ncbi:B-lymphocyte antigen CD19 isoform X4 [Phyllobates terribilis]|uniref:B-lymphocyte antigen CD19 isoform X4 n=1 Tax=Phyllobates terribilis TaxID=111132 RepID=UPI003CCB6798
MLLLLVLYLGITCSAKNPDYSRIIPVTAEGSTSLPCRHRSSDPVPLVLKLKMEEHSNHSWVVVAMTPIILMLDTNNLTLQLAPDNTSGNYSCSVDDAHLSELNDVVKEWITCRAPMNWTKMQWSRGWQLFLEGRYWIIVVVALSSALLCLLLVGGFVSIKRRRRVRRRAKSSFFKMSSAARNLYTESISPETDVAHKDQDFTYQNVSPSKVVGDDYYSDKGSFLSLGGDSYLEPMAEGGDQASDASGCYEDPTEDPDDPEDSIDGDCYENTNEEIKDGSEGSQSYEDMKGSICVRTKAEGPADEGTTQDEADADSYENMQTPLYSQPNWVLHPPHKSSEDQTEGTKGNLSEPATHQPQKVSTGLPQKVSTGLQEQNCERSRRDPRSSTRDIDADYGGQDWT